MIAYRCQGQGHSRSARDGFSGHAGSRHFYGGDGRWYNQQGGLESRYSDFVPYDYDDRNLLTRIVHAFNYARSSFFQTGSTSILNNNPSSFSASSATTNSSRTLCPSPHNSIEMISSSPSPTLHGTNSSRSSTSYHGSYRSPRSFVKPPPAAALPRTSAPAQPTSTSQKRPLSQSWPSPLRTATKDSATQYTPISTPSTASITADRRPTSPSPKTRTPPPEPALAPQAPSSEAVPLNAKPSIISASAPISNPPSSSASSTTTTTTTSDNSTSSSSKRPRPAAAPTKNLPQDYSRCPTNDLVTLITSMLLDLIAHNDSIPLGTNRLTRFHSRAPPGISVRDYLQRLTTHATLAPPILLSMVYYIDRLCSLYPAFTISSLTVHRFLITAATVASKGLSDSFWTNATYAKVGGVSLKELSLLELELLWRVEWRIVPRPEVLEDYYRSLVERTEGFGFESGKEGGKGRGRRSRSGSKGSEKGEGQGPAADGEVDGEVKGEAAQSKEKGKEKEVDMGGVSE